MLRSRIRTALDRSPRQWYYRMRRAFSGGRISDFDEAHPCVFVLSTGRVGTKTLSALLGAAANVFVYHEPRPRLFMLSKLAYRYARQDAASDVLREAFSVARKELLDYSLSCGKGYVETSPQVTFLAPHILKTVPEAKFIHLVRNPAAVVRSGMRRHWYAGHSYDVSRITPLPGTELYSRWGDLSPFQKNLWLWDETNRWILDFAAQVPERQKLLVQAERIFSADERVIDELFAFIAADVPAERKVKSILGKRLNVQRMGTFPAPNEWSPEMRGELVRVTGETAARLGYEIG